MIQTAAIAPILAAAWGEITGTLSDQADVQGALDAKAGTSHNHAGSEITSGIVPAVRLDVSSVTMVGPTVEWTEVQSIPAGFADGTDDGGAPGNDSVGSAHIIDSTITLADVNTTSLDTRYVSTNTSQAWTQVITTFTFSVTGTTTQTVPTLGFTPVANSTYMVQGYILVRTTVTTNGPRPGIGWPTGMAYNAGKMEVASSATAPLQRFWGGGVSQIVANTGLPDLLVGLAKVDAYFATGPSPSGNFQIILGAEIAAQRVEITTGSIIMYRRIQ